MRSMQGMIRVGLAGPSVGHEPTAVLSTLLTMAWDAPALVWNVPVMSILHAHVATYVHVTPILQHMSMLRPRFNLCSFYTPTL